METNTEPRRPSLFKQLLGSAGGAAVALLLYQGYKIGSPAVTAWLTVPQSQINANYPGAARTNAEVSEYDFNRLAARSKEIYQRFAAEPGPQAEISRTGIEVTQPFAASSNSIARMNPENLTAQSSVSSFSSSFGSVQNQLGQTSSAASSEASSSSVPSIPAEPAGSDAASSARARAETRSQAKLAGKKLPSSGIGTTLAAVLAFGSAAILRKKHGSK